MSVKQPLVYIVPSVFQSESFDYKYIYKNYLYTRAKFPGFVTNPECYNSYRIHFTVYTTDHESDKKNKHKSRTFQSGKVWGNFVSEKIWFEKQFSCKRLPACVATNFNRTFLRMHWQSMCQVLQCKVLTNPYAWRQGIWILL